MNSHCIDAVRYLMTKTFANRAKIIVSPIAVLLRKENIRVKDAALDVAKQIIRMKILTLRFGGMFEIKSKRIEKYSKSTVIRFVSTSTHHDVER